MAEATTAYSFSGGVITRPDLVLVVLHGACDVPWEFGTVGGGVLEVGRLRELGVRGCVFSLQPKLISMKAGFKRSIETVSCLPLRSSVKYFAALCSTRNGPSYVHCKSARCAS